MAIHLGKLHVDTKLWIRENEIYEEIVCTGENKTFLPEVAFPSSVSFYLDLKEALKDTEFIFIAVPSGFCRNMYEQMAPYLTPDQFIVSLTKGIEEKSLKRMSEVMYEVFPPASRTRIAVLSGPSFAREVAESHPTAVVISANNLEMAKKIQTLVSSLYFRAYSSDDIIGVELAGACKNVIAIATGISDSFGFGSNSMAGLVTRGLAEMTRLGVKLGARQETYAGLAGIGDLVLTCTGKLSRNRYVGSELGRGKTLEEIISGTKMIAEGITTTQSVHQLAQRENVETPICEQVYSVLYEGKNPTDAFRDLMSRELKDEYKT
ncbi:MAG: NAD(P)-dependent glycerol-3-phosphate dehydrogenase [Candidatus Aminicenantes bacterium]|nr:MAG: NAD(P)-dependent glycerol-3-phosphate dehydrogenase [Candidatus Aminicenantes bacterium]